MCMTPNRFYSIVKDIIPIIILFIIMGILIKLITYFYGKRKGNIWFETKAVFYLIYSSILFQLVTTTDFESYSSNFTPFKEILRYNINSRLFWLNVIGNICVFIPFAYIVADVIKMLCKKTNFIITMLCVIVTTVSIEIIQYYIGRTFDIDDIILNTFGGIIGYIIYKLIHKILRRDNEHI